MTNDHTPAHQEAAIQEGERIAAADEYFKARRWVMDTNDNRRIFEAGFDRAYALLSKLRAPVADERAAFEAAIHDEYGTSAASMLLRDADGDYVTMNTEWVFWLKRAALASAPVAGEAQEPAEYQRRCRPTWGNARVGWTEWERCTAAQAADCEKAPLVHDWQYEVRRLYAAPQASEAARDAALEEAAKAAYKALYPKNLRNNWTGHAELCAQHALRASRSIRALKSPSAALSAQPGAQKGKP